MWKDVRKNPNVIWSNQRDTCFSFILFFFLILSREKERYFAEFIKCNVCFCIYIVSTGVSSELRQSGAGVATGRIWSDAAGQRVVEEIQSIESRRLNRRHLRRGEPMVHEALEDVVPAELRHKSNSRRIEKKPRQKQQRAWKRARDYYGRTGSAIGDDGCLFRLSEAREHGRRERDDGHHRLRKEDEREGSHGEIERHDEQLFDDNASRSGSKW